MLFKVTNVVKCTRLVVPQSSCGEGGINQLNGKLQLKLVNKLYGILVS